MLVPMQRIIPGTWNWSGFNVQKEARIPSKRIITKPTANESDNRVIPRSLVFQRNGSPQKIVTDRTISASIIFKIKLSAPVKICNYDYQDYL